MNTDEIRERWNKGYQLLADLGWALDEIDRLERDSSAYANGVKVLESWLKEWKENYQEIEQRTKDDIEEALLKIPASNYGHDFIPACWPVEKVLQAIGKKLPGFKDIIGLYADDEGEVT